MNQATAFGAWLRERRKALDLTQTELGLRVNCTKAAIARLESGERRPSRQVAELLAVALGIAPADEAAFVQWARTGSSAPPTGFPPSARLWRGGAGQ